MYKNTASQYSVCKIFQHSASNFLINLKLRSKYANATRNYYTTFYVVCLPESVMIVCKTITAERALLLFLIYKPVLHYTCEMRTDALWNLELRNNSCSFSNRGSIFERIQTWNITNPAAVKITYYLLNEWYRKVFINSLKWETPFYQQYEQSQQAPQRIRYEYVTPQFGTQCLPLGRNPNGILVLLVYILG